MKFGDRKIEEERTPLKTEWIYRGKVIDLKVETFQLGNKTKVVEIIHHPGAVVILPFDSEGRLILIRQWRGAAKNILIELPAGTLEKKESPRECALRELREETGYKAGKLIDMGGFFTSPGFCNEYLHFYVASKLQLGPLEPDDNEAIDLFPVTIEEAKKLVEKNQIKDAKTIAGILKFLLVNSHA